MPTQELISAKSLRILGAVLLFWSGVNTYFDIARYGVCAGEYWWFCNLALMGTGIGCIMLDRGFVVGFLAISLFTQVFWIIDDLSILTTSQSIFGLAILRHRPDFPADEFLLSQYHYFTIPVGFLGWSCPDLKKGSPLFRVAVFNPFIFGVSYFLFSPERNINCIHKTCMPDFNSFAGPLYSFGFWFVIFAAHLLVAYGLEKLRTHPAICSERGTRGINNFVTILMALGVCCTLLAMSSRLT